MKNTEHNGSTETGRRLLQLALWTIGWVGTLALAKFGPGALWQDNPVASWAAVAVNLIIGVGWVVVHARYLQSVDDLQRKILLDAAAVALGAGLVGGLAVSVAHSAKLVAFEADLGLLSLLIGVVYLVSVAAGTFRYR